MLFKDPVVVNHLPVFGRHPETRGVRVSLGHTCVFKGLSACPAYKDALQTHVQVIIELHFQT